MIIKTLFLQIIGLVLCTLTIIYAKPAQSPIRVRVNKSVFINLVNLRDQEIFNAF